LEENYRKVVVAELGHRVKNKLATVYAILRHELRQHPSIWESVSGRLRALSTADDLLTEADGHGLELTAVISKELSPYPEEQISISGESVLLPGKLAVSLALVIHELATNAAKYGALSVSNGSIDVSWNRTDQELQILWTENKSPSLVLTPARKGFGTKLIEGALTAFGGSVESQLLPHGLRCSIRIPLRAISEAPDFFAGRG